MNVAKRACTIASILACLLAIFVAIWAPDPWSEGKDGGKNACPLGYGGKGEERQRTANQAAVAFVRGNLWTGQEKVRGNSHEPTGRSRRNGPGDDGAKP